MVWWYQGASACIDGCVMLVDLIVGDERETHMDGDLILYHGHLNVFGFYNNDKEIKQRGLILLAPFFYKDENEEQNEEGHEDGDEDGDLDEDRKD